MGQFSKIVLRVVVLTCIVGMSYNSFAAEQAKKPKTVQWHSDLKKARKVAVKSGKPMLLVFTADWCGYCKKMEKKTLGHPKMAEYVNDNFVPIHVDFDKSKHVVDVLEIKSIPATVVLSPDVDLLGRLVGYSTPKKYYQALEKSRLLNKKIQQVKATQAADDSQ